MGVDSDIDESEEAGSNWPPSDGSLPTRDAQSYRGTTCKSTDSRQLSVEKRTRYKGTWKGTAPTDDPDGDEYSNDDDQSPAQSPNERKGLQRQDKSLTVACPSQKWDLVQFNLMEHYTCSKSSSTNVRKVMFVPSYLSGLAQILTR